MPRKAKVVYSNVYPKFRDPLDDLLERPIAYSPVLARITGSITAGLFLSQAWYWSKRHPNEHGWFYKTQAEWEEETCLSRFEQEGARKRCRELGLISEDLRGVPATKYYRVERENLLKMLGIQYASFPQSSLNQIPEYAEKQQSGKPANFNNEPETPPINKEEEEEISEKVKTVANLYEQNIGAITPLVADLIRNAAIDYPLEWFEPAFKAAVENNVRKWSYVEAVLQNWFVHGFGWKPEPVKGKSRGNGKSVKLDEQPEDMEETRKKLKATLRE